MKRYIGKIRQNEELLEMEIDVTLYDAIIYSGTILDLDDPEYLDFESNVLTAFEIHGFELDNYYTSNNKNSASQYYIFTKTNEEGTKLQVLVKLRVSDHTNEGRKVGEVYKSSRKLSQGYVKKLAKDIAEERYGQTRGYRGREIDIVFDDNHYTSFEKALRAIEDRLDEFDN